MSEIRNGLDPMYDAGAPLLDAIDELPVCFICCERVNRGAHWSADVFICSACVLEGKVGLLIDDALDRSEEITLALERTARQAWRARVLARERREGHARATRSESGGF